MGNSSGNQFVEEKGGASMCGCYVRRPEALGLKFQKAIVPLRNIDYHIEIVNSLANITLKQTYQNPIGDYLEVDYSMPICPESSIYKFQVEFNKVVIQGIVKEKEEAKKLHEKAKAEGRQAVIGTIDPDSKDIFNIEIGNIPPRTKFVVTLCFLQEMNIGTNTFYQLKVPASISPRYMNQVDGVVKISQHMLHEGEKSGPADYKWNFTIDIKSSRRVIFFDSPSHSIKLTSQNEQGTSTQIQMQKSQVPSKDFQFIYTTEDFHVPSFVMGKTDTTSTVMLSFIPKFSNLEVTDAYKAYIQNSLFEVDMEKAKGEYVFLLDRSGSMSGKRIQQAKRALLLFLKSLPEDSYFNIVSFGFGSQKMFTKSERANIERITEASEKVKLMQADLGGTEIYNPLQSLLKQNVIDGYAKQIFLLTDGDVSNTSGVIDMVGKSIKYSRVHTIGIGSGASQSLIEGCSKAGKGKFITVSDDENPAEKIIGLLESALTPLISKVDLKCSNSDQIESIVPNPKSIPYILKDDILNFYITFKQNLQKNTKFTLNFQDPLTKAPCSSQLVLTETTINQPFVDKMSHLKVLRQLEKSAKQGLPADYFMHYSAVKDYKEEAVRYSVRYQVLSEFTAFLCEGKQLVDGQYQEYKDKGVHKIWVDQPKTNYIDQSSYQNMSLAATVFNQNRPSGAPQLRAMRPPVAPQLQAMTYMAPISMMMPSQNSIQRERSMPMYQCLAPTKKIAEENLYCSQQREQQSIKMSMPPSYSMKQHISFSPSIKKQQDLLTQIIQLQNPNGSWSQTNTPSQLLQLLQKNPAKISELCSKLNPDIVVTKLIITWLQKHHPGKEYALILKKAMSWLNKRMQEEGLVEANLGEVQSV